MLLIEYDKKYEMSRKSTSHSLIYNNFLSSCKDVCLIANGGVKPKY